MVQPVIQLLKVATIGILAVLIAVGAMRLIDHEQQQALPDDVGQQVSFTVGPDDDTDIVAANLREEGLIRSEAYFKTRFRIANSSLAPGTYTLTRGMPVSDIIGVITANAATTDSGGAAEAETLTITVIEGWRTEQIAEKLDELGLDAGYDGFMEAVRTFPADSYDFLAERPDPTSLEGYLFPDTYNFKTDTAPEDIIALMLDNFDARIAPDMRAQAEANGWTFYQSLIFASLVEREAAVSEERPIIADIYQRRYLEDWRLQADPTVQYILGEKGNWWPELTGSDLEVDDPYNTYFYYGLPPGPICNPGYSSIDAALNPLPNPYYFFYATMDGSGTHLFAIDLDSQTQNINYVNGEADAPAPGSKPFEDGVLGVGE